MDLELEFPINYHLNLTSNPVIDTFAYLWATYAPFKSICMKFADLLVAKEICQIFATLNSCDSKFEFVSEALSDPTPS